MASRSTKGYPGDQPHPEIKDPRLRDYIENPKKFIAKDEHHSVHLPRRMGPEVENAKLRMQAQVESGTAGPTTATGFKGRVQDIFDTMHAQNQAFAPMKASWDNHKQEVQKEKAAVGEEIVVVQPQGNFKARQKGFITAIENDEDGEAYQIDGGEDWIYARNVTKANSPGQSVSDRILRSFTLMCKHMQEGCEFDVEINRNGQMLGAIIDDSLTIMELEEGAIAKYNTMNVDKQIFVGDRFLEVNAVETASRDQFREALGREQVMTAKIRRKGFLEAVQEQEAENVRLTAQVCQLKAMKTSIHLQIEAVRTKTQDIKEDMGIVGDTCDDCGVDIAKLPDDMNPEPWLPYQPTLAEPRRPFNSFSVG